MSLALIFGSKVLCLANISDHRYIKQWEGRGGAFSNKGTIFNFAGPSHCYACRNGSAVPWEFDSPAQAVGADSCLDGKILCLEHVGIFPAWVQLV